MTKFTKLLNWLMPEDERPFRQYIRIEYGESNYEYVLSRVKAGKTLDDIRREL